MSDLRRALRALGRAPGFTVVAVLALSVGLGSALSALAILDALFLRPIPGVGEPEGLARVRLSGASSYPNFRDLERDATTVSELAAFADFLVALEAGSERARALAVGVSPDYFRALRVAPAVGALPQQHESPEVLLGHALWRDSFGSDPGVVGRVVRVNGQPLRVSGVAPEGFVGTFLGFRFDLWFPLELAPSLVSGVDLEDRSLDRLELVGRLGPGVGLRQAGAELAGLGEGLRVAHPEVNRDLVVSVEEVTGFDQELRRAALAVALLLLALASGVLAVAVSNVAGLLLARTLSRRRDLAVHAALGASRVRLASVAGLEALLVTAAGTAGGLALAATLPRWVATLESTLPVRLALDVGPDPRLALAAVALAVVVIVAVGLPAAWQGARATFTATLRQGLQERSGLRRILLGAQVAVSAALLLLAALFLRALSLAASHDPGFSVDRLMVASFVDLAPLGLEEEAAVSWFASLTEDLAGRPQVDSAAAFDRLPLTLTGRGSWVASGPGLEPRPEEGVESTVAVVSAGFFAALGLPLRQGRSFAATDDKERPLVAVVDTDLAGRLWPEGSALGERLRLGGDIFEVIGVAESALPLAGAAGARPKVYLPLGQHPVRRMHVLVRPAGPIEGVAALVLSELRQRAPALPPPQVQPLAGFLGIALLPQRVAGVVGSALGGVALLLSTTGLYALLAYLVARRRRELGVRLALGATPRELARWALRRGVGPALGGALLGVAAAIALARLLSGMLLGVQPSDPLALAGVLLTLGAASVAGSFVPVRRALRTDPMTSLRQE